MLDEKASTTDTTDDADALRRLRNSMGERQNALYNEAHDLLDDHISAMISLHPELSDAVGLLLGVFLGDEHNKVALKPTLRMLGLAAPGLAGRAAALYDVSLLLEEADVRRLRRSGLSSLEIDLGLRERWLVSAKERLAEAFGESTAQDAVRMAVAEREERHRWPIAD